MIKLKKFYEHEHSPSVFIMFKKNYEVVWSYSGNELRRVHLENPSSFISEPLEVPIPKHLDEKLNASYEDF